MISDSRSLGSEKRPKEQKPANKISCDNKVTKRSVTSALLLILDNVAKIYLKAKEKDAKIV